MNESFQSGSFILPITGSYSCPPAKVLETFWAYKQTSDGQIIHDRNDMRLMYREVDHVTWECIGPAKDMTEDLWFTLVSTKDHPHFL